MRWRSACLKTKDGTPAIGVLRSIFTTRKYPLHAWAGSAETLLVELLQLGVRTPEVAARRRDVAVSGEALRRGHVHLGCPRGDRGVPQPVRRHALGEAGAL